MKPKITWPTGGSWNLSEPIKRSRGVRGARSEVGPELMTALRSALEEEKVEIIAERTAVVRQTQARTSKAETEAISITTDATEDVVMLLQQESGALIIRRSESSDDARARGRRRAGATTVTRHFSMPDLFPEEEESAPSLSRGSRGILSKVVRIVLVKVLGKVAQKAAAALVAAWERKTWEKKAAERPLGWVKVVFSSGQMNLQPVKLTPSMLAQGPCLLLIHGTFSNTTSCFGDLASSAAFVNWAQKHYGDQIFAFNHFTMSQTPEENARELLKGLPTKRHDFDVITHSRGGLVLRETVFASGPSGAFAARNVVLVAAPNAGTPLATSKRWDEVLTLFANLGDLFPAVGDAVSWVASTLKWIAGLVGDEIPGLASMNMNGDQIRRLEERQPPGAQGWQALVSNYHPGKAEKWWLRLLDAGIDRFFQVANDLVVPTEGGWKLHGSSTIISAAHIGCFGPGGNLLTDETGRVHHLNFFEQAEVVTFLSQALEGRSPALTRLIDPALALPARIGRRGGGSAPAFNTGGTPHLAHDQMKVEPPVVELPAADKNGTARAPELRPDTDPDTFSILILGGSREGALTIETDEEIDRDHIFIPPKLLATYGTAQVLADFPVRDSTPVRELRRLLRRNNVNESDLKRACEEVESRHLQGDDGLMGTRFQEVIAITRDIHLFTIGESEQMPEPERIRKCGRLLFELMMRPEARRLYDLARARRAGRPLYVNFTSQIPWIASAPWELALDPHAGGSERMDAASRSESSQAIPSGAGSHLATGEVIFSRNVLTPRPAAAPRKQGRLRILVVSAQPLDAGRLSIQEESELMLRGFRDLEQAGLAVLHALPQADPVALQQTLALHEFDVVHIISHGSFDTEDQSGGLHFVDAMGGTQHLPERDLCLILGSRGVRIVFLNACESGTAGHKRFNSGLAASLVEAGVPAVVANQFTVDDLSATLFSQHFYWYLAHGLTIGEAARESRVTLRWLVGTDSIDWAVPVLYTGDPHMRLCEKFGEPSRLNARPLGASARTTSRGVAGKSPRLKIAIWDVAYHFPALRSIVEEMNRVQSMFDFSSEDASMPFGLRVWNISKAGALREKMFDADAAETKLKNLPALLGADIVTCIIDQLISGSGWEGLYINSYDKFPVSIASTSLLREKLGLAGGKRTPEQELREKRFIVHIVHNCIIWLKSSLEECASGSKNCSLYFDPHYDMAFLDKPTLLCDKCRKAFSFKPAPAMTAEALEALNKIAKVGFEG